MSSCRATSFYLAPGVMRYFRDHTLVAVLPDGTWIEITHRNDIARLRAMHPGWNGTVLCGPRGGASKLRESLLDDPAQVERWNLDERVVEGRRPSGPQFVLHRLAWGGVTAVGGVRQAVSQVLPGANKTLRTAAESLLGEHGEKAAMRLSMCAALRGVLTDDEIARLISTASAYELQTWLGVEIDRFRENFLRATEATPESRRRLAAGLLSGEVLSGSEIEAAVAASERLSPDVLAWLVEHGWIEDRMVARAVAKQSGLSEEVQMRILLGEHPYAIDSLAQNPELTGEVVEAAWRAGAELYALVEGAPLSAAVMEYILTEEPYYAAALSRNQRLTDEQCENLAKWALSGQSPVDSENVFSQLALNPRLSTELRCALAEKSESDYVWFKLASQSELPEELQERVLRHGNYDAFSALFVNNSVSTDVLRRFVADDHANGAERVLSLLVSRDDVDAAEAARLVEQAGPDGLSAIVRGARFPETVTLALDRAQHMVREGAWEGGPHSDTTSQTWTPADITESLLLVNPEMATPEIMTRLALDANGATVRLALQSRAAVVPEEVRLELAKSAATQMLREEALQVEQMMPSLQMYAFSELEAGDTSRQWLLRRAELHDDVEREAVREGNLQELMALASNRRELQNATVDALLRHQSPNVRRLVARRGDLSEQHLAVIASDIDSEVREQADPVVRRATEEKWHKKVETEAHLERLIGHFVSSDVPVAPVRETARSSSGVVTPRGSDAPSRRREMRDGDDIHHLTRVAAHGARMKPELAHHPIEYVAHPAAVLRESVHAGSDDRAHLFEGAVRSVRDLPGWGAAPFPGMRSARASLDGYRCEVSAAMLENDSIRSELTSDEQETAVMVPLRARVLDSETAISKNAEYMGNCTSGYLQSVARGDVLLVALDDENGKCVLNVELTKRGDGVWEPGEINTRFNGYGYGYENTPESVQEIARGLAQQVGRSREPD